MRTKFEAHRWYSINIIFDWFSQVFDLVVDGVVVGTRVPFEDNHVCLYINTCVGVGVRITCTHTHTHVIRTRTHTHTHTVQVTSLGYAYISSSHPFSETHWDRFQCCDDASVPSLERESPCVCVCVYVRVRVKVYVLVLDACSRVLVVSSSQQTVYKFLFNNHEVKIK